MLAVSLVLFIAVALHYVTTGTGATGGTTLLLVLPVSLVALARGRVAGVNAGAGALLFIAGAALIRHVDVLSTGSGVVAVALVLIGYLLGDASQRLERAEEARMRAEAKALRQRDAVKINDDLVQGVAAAKWALEGGDPERSLLILETTIDEGQRLVSELMRDADPPA